MNLISNKCRKFIDSIKIGDIEEAKSNFVVDYFKQKDEYGLKPIHWACLSSNMDILRWMLENKCKIESASRHGWRPIHFSSFIGNEEMVEFLIERSCELDCKTDNGESILDVANGDCNHEFINEILKENINLKIGLSMGLKCGGNCIHDFCLRSLIRPEYLIDWISRSNQPKNIIQITDSYSDRTFAVKVIKSHEYDIYENKKCIGPKINEILPNLNHLKIKQYYGLIKIESKMILFMEWGNNGTLKNQIPNIKLNNAKIYRYCKDILQAVAFLHDNKILHRFIHPAKNIFIDNNGGCKLAISNYSYSLADGDVQIDDEWLRKYLKYSYDAPELVKNGILSYPYDIWLLGCTVIEMANGSISIYNNYKSNKFDTFHKIISEIPNEMLRLFIRSMVTRNIKERASANELLNHDFIKNNNYLSIFDNSLINRKKSINIIQNAINNKQ